jgi:hypothetical protein
MREALALLIPAGAIGVWVFPALPSRAASALAASLALCLGIGFSSLTSTVLVVLGVAPATSGFVLADAAIWVSVAALGWWMRRERVRSEPLLSGSSARSPEPRIQSREPETRNLDPGAGSRKRNDRSDWILRAAFAVTATIALASVITTSLAAPHGDWDAWAIWNQHARFMFRAGGGDEWRAFLAINWSQPDYPLLLPASVARTWAYAGHESTTGPIVIAMVLGMASVALVVTALDGRRAWIAGMVILGAQTFLTQIWSQCADVPLACFIVATLAVACGNVLRTASPETRIRVANPESRIAVLIAGATAAMAAWTKNEGLVFALLMLLLAVAAAVRRRDGRLLLWGIAGGAPFAIAVLWFKLTLAPPSGLGEGLSLDVLVTRLFDLHRHVTVALLIAQQATDWSAPFAPAIFPLMGLAAIWMAIRRGRAVRAMAAVIAVMLVSYYFVYVITPFDIAWHVSTSIDRLLAQLWPSLVLIVFSAPTARRSRSMRQKAE